MGCAGTFLKVVSGIFTVYFTLVSVAFLIYGALTAIVIIISSSQSLLELNVAVASVATVIFGGILLILVIIGCVAVFKEISLCIETYSFFLMILTIAQIGVGFYALYTFTPNNLDLRTKVEDSIRQEFNYYYNRWESNMENIHLWLKCCGKYGPTDWAWPNRSLPPTCCGNQTPECDINSSLKYNRGCYDNLFNFIVETNFILGWALIIVALTEFVAAVIGINLSCVVWRNRGPSWI